MAKQVKITWTQSTGNTVAPTSHIVQRSATENGTYTTIYTALGVTVEHTDVNVLDGETWWYRVGAVFASGTIKYLAAEDITISVSATYIDGVFSLDATYLVKSGTDYVCQATSATLSGGYGTTALLVGDFRVRCELESATGGFAENVKSIIGASTTQTRSILVADFSIYANALTSLDVRVDGAAVTEDNSTAPVYAAGNYIIVERIGSTVKFIQDVGGTETVVHTATGQTTNNLYMFIQQGEVDNWIQKPEYLLL